MEDVGQAIRMNPYKITTMEKSTFLVASSTKDAIKKYLKGIPDLKEWTVTGKIGGSLIINFDDKEEIIPMTPILINLSIITKDEGVAFLARYYTDMSKEAITTILDDDIQKYQWILDK
jgi:ssDNA-specific exonuclease RecJ